MSKVELLTEVIQIRVTPKHFKKIEKKAQSEVLSTATFARQQLVKSLNLQE